MRKKKNSGAICLHSMCDFIGCPDPKNHPTNKNTSDWLWIELSRQIHRNEKFRMENKPLMVAKIFEESEEKKNE